MTTSATPTVVNRARILQAVQQYWGYDQLRPHQIEAITAGLERQDSLVVLPTGGGKSLCYQVPPLVAQRTDIVVSPLISLMKDQVDALAACGYPSAALYSSVDERERRDIELRATAGQLRLLFVAPERLLTPGFLSLARRINVRAFAIDEAHCISHWGHDFRPEYRRLAALKQHFPEASVHAYTATATDRVRQDIVAQLGLRTPCVLVGRFDRPNLIYRAVPRHDLEGQLLDVIRRHASEAVIVYCISRADTERTASALQARGVKAAAYHAGLDARARTRTQDDFAAEKLDVVVATVAFGMGIDRSNVRCVIHAALPKSVEQYQQETGRAGRDGLEAECVLLFSPTDARRWESLIRRSAEEAGQDPEVTAAQTDLLQDMQRLSSSQQCRHRALSRYFGQDYEQQNCGACDVCLTPPNRLENGAEIARQVLACVRDLGIPFGVTYVVDVLTGSKSARIQQQHHESLREFGALKALSKDIVRDVVYQLVDQGLLERTAGDRPVLLLRAAVADDVLAGRKEVAIFSPRSIASQQTVPNDGGWRDVDRGLFERLRDLRRTVATERSVPAFVILGDAALREMARLRPTNLATFGQVRGIGDRKLADLGERFIAAIAAYCRDHGLAADVVASELAAKTRSAKAGSVKEQAYALFNEGCSLQEAAAKTGRAQSTVASYLEDYVTERKPASVTPWVDAVVYDRVKATGIKVGGSYLRPVFEALCGEVGYDEIRIVLRHAGLR